MNKQTNGYQILVFMYTGSCFNNKLILRIPINTIFLKKIVPCHIKFIIIIMSFLFYYTLTEAK